MSDLSQARFKIDLKFGLLSSGKSMKAVMIHDGKECPGFSVDLKLPTKITLVVSGKNMSLDTKIDKDGKILEDLYIKIIGVSLDGFDPGVSFLHQKIKLVTEDGVLTTPYLGFNGHVDFIMDQPTVFHQVMHWKNVA
jgi:hypothetical protein